MLEEFKPASGAIKKRKRKGRGNASGLGGECGRGHKGQKSRSGYKSRPGFEGGQTPLYRRLPKKRGIRNPFRLEYVPINLETIASFFQEGDSVTPETLFEKGLIKKSDRYKILALGGIQYKKLSILTYKISKSAEKQLKDLGIQVDFIDI